MTTFYAIANVNGPISVRLSSASIDAALAEFESADTRAYIDGASTDAEVDFDIDGADMSENEFDDALRNAGLRPIKDLNERQNANAGTVSHLADGWYLWAHE